MNNKDLVVLAIYGYILFFVLKKDQTIEMILLTVAAYFSITSSLFNGLFDIIPQEIEGLTASATVDTASKVTAT